MLIREITLRNLLSFGPETPPFALRNLNVLIGPNGSGKSNFIEAIGLLRALPTDVSIPIIEGGGIQEWLWKGGVQEKAVIGVELKINQLNNVLFHRFELLRHELSVRIGWEEIFGVPREEAEEIINKRQLDFDAEDWATDDQASNTSFSLGEKGSRLSNRRQSYMSGDRGSELILGVSDGYSNIRIYKEWNFGRGNPIRFPQSAGMKSDQLEEGLANLGLVLKRMKRGVEAKKAMSGALEAIYEGVTDVDIDVFGGSFMLYLEEGRHVVPASRLSDGTLRYLCLLAILRNPQPPPLICIEEPELGMHPDALLTICKLIEEASERTQLIITTHSEFIVDYFSRDPEAIVVCEKGENGTTMTRLDEKELGGWLKEYTLGNLWRSGQIGGNRW